MRTEGQQLLLAAEQQLACRLDVAGRRERLGQQDGRHEVGVGAGELASALGHGVQVADVAADEQRDARGAEQRGGARAVVGLDAPGLADEQLVGGERLAAEQHDRGPHELEVGVDGRVVRLGQQVVERVARHVEPAGQYRGARALRAPADARARGRQAARALERLGRCRQRAAALRRARGVLEGGRDLFVGGGGRGGQVPGARLGLGVLGERRVRRPPGRQRRAPVHGRAHERVAEDDAVVAALDQARRLGRGQGVDVDTARPQRGGHRRQRVGVRRGDHEQRLACALRQRAHAPAVDALQAGARRQGIGERLAAAALGVGELCGHLPERERVARRRGDEPLTYRGRHALLAQQRERGVALQPAHDEDVGAWPAGRIELLAGGQQQRRPAGPQPLGHEAQRVERRAVQPLGIVDDDEHGRVGGGQADQRERRREDGERVADRRRR